MRDTAFFFVRDTAFFLVRDEALVLLLVFVLDVVLFSVGAAISHLRFDVCAFFGLDISWDAHAKACASI